MLGLGLPSADATRTNVETDSSGDNTIHIPLGRFSRDTIDRIRRFHVLNGKRVRSYAARFIRDL